MPEQIIIKIIFRSKEIRGRVGDHDGSFSIVFYSANNLRAFGIMIDPTNIIHLISPSQHFGEREIETFFKLWMHFIEALCLRNLIISQKIAFAAWEAAQITTDVPNNSGLETMKSHLGTDRVLQILNITPVKDENTTSAAA